MGAHDLGSRGDGSFKPLLLRGPDGQTFHLKPADYERFGPVAARGRAGMADPPEAWLWRFDAARWLHVEVGTTLEADGRFRIVPPPEAAELLFAAKLPLPDDLKPLLADRFLSPGAALELADTIPGGGRPVGLCRPPESEGNAVLTFAELLGELEWFGECQTTSSGFDEDDDPNAAECRLDAGVPIYDAMRAYADGLPVPRRAQDDWDRLGRGLKRRWYTLLKLSRSHRRDGSYAVPNGLNAAARELAYALRRSPPSPDHATVPADAEPPAADRDFNGLLTWAETVDPKTAKPGLTGKALRVIRAVAAAGGSLPLKELAATPDIDWDIPFDNAFSKAKKGINEKLAAAGLPYELARVDNVVRILPRPASA